MHSKYVGARRMRVHNGLWRNSYPFHLLLVDNSNAKGRCVGLLYTRTQIDQLFKIRQWCPYQGSWNKSNSLNVYVPCLRTSKPHTHVCGCSTHKSCLRVSLYDNVTKHGITWHGSWQRWFVKLFEANGESECSIMMAADEPKGLKPLSAYIYFTATQKLLFQKINELIILAISNFHRQFLCADLKYNSSLNFCLRSPSYTIKAAVPVSRGVDSISPALSKGFLI